MVMLAIVNVIYTGYWGGHTEGVRESGGMLADLPYTYPLTCDCRGRGGRDT